MKSICFVAHDAYGAMCGGSFGHVGGVERQTSLMSKWFAARGYRVSLLTWDDGQPDEQEIDGVRVIKLCRRSSGLPGLRFVHPRWTSLRRGLRKADADLYYHNSAEYVTGQVAAWCRHRGRRFVYSVASEPACDGAMPLLTTLRERTLYRYGVRAADAVLVQTATQRRLIREGFGRDAQIVPMPCPGPGREEYVTPSPPQGNGRVLWVGRFADMKRLEWLLDVAAAMPDVSFHVAGGGSGDYPDRLAARGATLANVVMHGSVPRDRLSGLYRASACLCCTSSYEGFPNTFLEAWSHGIPVVTTFDPDGLVARLKLGAVARDRDGLVAAIRTMLTSGEAWQSASANGRRYYLEHHTPEAALCRFERAFLDQFDNVGVAAASPACPE